MKITFLKTNILNQNNYNQNVLTPEFVGSLIIYPIGYTHEKCLPCDGFVLKIYDYENLYSVISTKFNSGTEAADEFRIPDYNISKRFLQPSTSPSDVIEAGLPDITGAFGLSGTEGGGTFANGAFSWYKNGGAYGRGHDNAAVNPHINFYASRSSLIYGKSSTVQPPAQGVHVCIRYK